jgi:hypothetical protein
MFGERSSRIFGDLLAIRRRAHKECGIVLPPFEPCINFYSTSCRNFCTISIERDRSNKSRNALRKKSNPGNPARGSPGIALSDESHQYLDAIRYALVPPPSGVAFRNVLLTLRVRPGRYNLTRSVRSTTVIDSSILSSTTKRCRFSGRLGRESRRRRRFLRPCRR